MRRRRPDANDVIGMVGGALFLIAALPGRWVEVAAIWLLCLLAYLYGRSVGSSHRHDAF